MKKFPSKIGTEIILLISASQVPVTLIMIFQQLWTGLFITALAMAFTIHMFKNTYYLVDGQSLIVRCSIFVNQRIALADIQSIRPTNNPISAPAASLDRLEVKYGYRKSVIISPKDKQGFVEAVQAVNPNCVYLSK